MKFASLKNFETVKIGIRAPLHRLRMQSVCLMAQILLNRTFEKQKIFMSLGFLTRCRLVFLQAILFWNSNDQRNAQDCLNNPSCYLSPYICFIFVAMMNKYNFNSKPDAVTACIDFGRSCVMRLFVTSTRFLYLC